VKADKFLLENIHGWSPLFVAVQIGDVAVLQVLLQAGVNVNKVDAGGLTPLYMAAMWGHAAVTAALLNAGATGDMAVVSDGATALMVAAESGH